MREIKFRAWDNGNMYYFPPNWIDKYTEKLSSCNIQDLKTEMARKYMREMF